jgi:hypothetical protein
MMRQILAASLLLVSLMSAGTTRATIIGHVEADGVTSLPQTTMDSIGDQRWLFAHASVGANMVDGMTTLHGENALRYQLVFQTYGDGSQIYPPPAVTVPGTVYDAPRGNPGWAAKFAMFDNAVRNLGWRSPKIDIAMNKLCYIDTDADANAYIASMTALESSYPATVFVYTTMPLQSGAGADGANILATNYNNAVRAHCAGPGRILLDIADIESYDTSGNHNTFVYLGHTYERMWSGYTTDGGHLNALGSRRVALGWYAAAAAIGNTSGVGTGETLDGGLTISAIAPNPTAGSTIIHFQLPSAGSLRLELYDPQGRFVATLADERVQAGVHAIAWNGRDRNGEALPAGVYLVLLRTDDGIRSRTLTLVR